jgi:hypothetical protein
VPEPHPAQVPRSERPDFARPVEGVLRADPRGQRTWTRDECVDAAVRYLLDLRPGERSSQRGYHVWKKRQPDDEDLPWSSVMARCGGWDAIRADAWSRIAQRRDGR